MIRKDTLTKRIELRLLSINDLVAAEAKYHVTCRKNFENPFSVSTPGRPAKRDNQENFEKAFIATENDMDLYQNKCNGTEEMFLFKVGFNSLIKILS